MTVIFPKDILKDLANGGYKKEEEDREKPDPEPEPGPDPEPDPDPKPDPEPVVVDYEQLTNLPQINHVELKGNKSLYQLGLRPFTVDQMLDIFDALD